MTRPVTLFTGQWADLKLEDLARKANEFGYQGLELACWGDHFDVDKALSDDRYCAASAICSNATTCNAMPSARTWSARPCSIVDRPAPQGHLAGARLGQRQTGRSQRAGRRRAEEDGPRGPAAGRRRRQWLYRFEHLAPALFLSAGADRDDRSGLQAAGPAVQSDPRRVRRMRRPLRARSRIRRRSPSTVYSAQRTLGRIGHREEFGFNFDPSHLLWQGVDPVEFLRAFPGPHLPRPYQGRDRDLERTQRHPVEPFGISATRGAAGNSVRRDAAA